MATEITTARLKLVAVTRDEARAYILQMDPADRAQVSPAWLALLENSAPTDPWIHGFNIRLRNTDTPVGRCGYKGPPDEHGVVEIAYGIDPAHRNRGYATEAANGLTQHAFSDPRVRQVIAHTLPESNASTRVLSKCGFQHEGQVVDPDDGPVWRWIRTRPNSVHATLPNP